MKLKKIVSIILLILILVNSMSGIANAFEVNSAYVENLGDCGQHLQFKLHQEYGVMLLQQWLDIEIMGYYIMHIA